MKKQVAIIGLGQFGDSLAREISDLGNDVLAIDIDEKKVQHIISERPKIITHAVIADATDETALTDLGLNNFDVAVVAMGADIQSSVLATVLLKKIGVPFVIARAANDLHESILKKIGADTVIFVEREMGVRVAHDLEAKDEIGGILVAAGYSVVKVEVLPQMVDKKLSDLQLGRGGSFDIAALLIQRQREVIFNPPLMDVFKDGDVLIMSGSDDNIGTWLEQIKTSEKENKEKE